MSFVVHSPTAPTPGTITPPIGLPTVGGFVNPAGSAVSSQNLLPAIPPAVLARFSVSAAVSQIMADQRAGLTALAANARASVTAPSSSTSSVNPNVGSEGSPGLDGAAAMLGAGASLAISNVTPTANAVPVGTLAQWQMTNPGLDMLGRIALPITAFFLYRRGETIGAVAAAAPAVALWYNRLVGGL